MSKSHALENSNLKTRVLAVARLPRSQRKGLFALYSSLFDGASEDIFMSDLKDKDEVILLENGGRLVGFSTLKKFDHSFQGRTISFLFSGDTVVDKASWTSTSGVRVWLAEAFAYGEMSPNRPVYWLLLAGSYRTYRSLPVLFQTYHPKVDVPIPWDVLELMKSVASSMFGEAYLPKRGIVRFPGAPALRRNLSGIPKGRLKDPEVAFYLRSNPDYKNGDELVCLAEISRKNLSPVGLRMLR